MGDLHLSYGLTWHDRHSLMAGMGLVASQSNHSSMKLFSAQYQYHVPYHIEIGTLSWQPFHFGIGLLKAITRIYSPPYPTNILIVITRLLLCILFNYQSRVQINKHWQVSFHISAMDVALINLTFVKATTTKKITIFSA